MLFHLQRLILRDCSVKEEVIIGIRRWAFVDRDTISILIEVEGLKAHEERKDIKVLYTSRVILYE